MAESEFKLVIKIDPEKTEKYGYDYQEVVEAVEAVCNNCHCINQGEGVFTGRGLNTDAVEVHGASWRLCQSPWFQKCVGSIEWFAPRGEHIDLIEYHKKRSGFVFG